MIAGAMAELQGGTAQPDDRHDVIVQHVTPAAQPGTIIDRWMVLAGEEKRAELDDARRALVYANLLAHLRQGRVWIRHGDADIQPVDSNSIRGCSCC